MTRYALYFAPSPDSAWWRTASRWLGRDPMGTQAVQQLGLTSLPRMLMQELTKSAARYGFHATLKAPFQLVEGMEEQHLERMASAFCALQQALPLHDLVVKPMGDFLALRPAAKREDINALAMRCVSYFDLLRAAPDAAYLAKRRHIGLSERQEALLQRWGYPYTEEEYRFHLTLSDSLAQQDPETVYQLRKAAEAHFAALIEKEPMSLDALSIFREDQPGADFVFWRRFPFANSSSSAAIAGIPQKGRIVFVVGDSGVGKDSLISWLRQRCVDHSKLIFARRVITRPTEANEQTEQHESMSSEAFWQAAAAGQFCMQWHAHDLQYGLRRGIQADLQAGRDVIVNGSREYLPQLLIQYPDAHIVWVVADHQKINQRMQNRQRESGADMQGRLLRNQQLSASMPANASIVENNGSLASAGEAFLKALGWD
jgi:phosphonate metabolism protein PhnN/1,5-bisphosphokinase (PRPP-forming)